MLAARLMAPVAASRLRPVVLLKVPPAVPVMVGEGLLPLWQNVLLAYEKAAEVAGFTVTCMAEEVAEQLPVVTTTE